ncbi:MAG: ATP-binding protein [Cyclobacteriaceae bacterium]
MIKRELFKTIFSKKKKGFVNVIYGPRRVGKTVLLEQIASHYKGHNILKVNGDTAEATELLSTNSEVKLSRAVDNYQIIMVDEAQRISNIGLSLKIIVDKYPDKEIFITGSSSLQLTKGIYESLTGRNIVYTLYPLSTRELGYDTEPYKWSYFLDEQLVYGTYPYLLQLSKPIDKQEYLKAIIDDYLFKDILDLERIDNPENLHKLAVLLAWQIGQLVSFSELAKKIHIDVKTVIRYIDLLKKNHVVFELGSYSTNLRNEVGKSKKYFFYDLGIRNALLGQFSMLDIRQDTGNLWENFLIVERKKNAEYKRILAEYYFWRNYQGAEVDFLEIKDGEIYPFEFKWTNKKVKTPANFYENYGKECTLVNRENYLDFIDE